MRQGFKTCVHAKCVFMTWWASGRVDIARHGIAAIQLDIRGFKVRCMTRRATPARRYVPVLAILLDTGSLTGLYLDNNNNSNSNNNSSNVDDDSLPCVAFELPSVASAVAVTGTR
jgi:hypothetical protein